MNVGKVLLSAPHLFELAALLEIAGKTAQASKEGK